MQNGILQCVNQQVLPNGAIGILQKDDGTTLYHETLYHNPGYGNKLTFKQRGDVKAQLEYGPIDVLAVYGNVVYFAKSKRIHKAVLTPHGTIQTTVFRDRIKDEEFHSRGICSVRDGKLYLHRLCDDPNISGVFIPEDDVCRMTLHDFHRGKEIYLNNRSDIEHPRVRVVCENVMALEFSRWVPGWAYSRDSSRFIYIGDSQIVHTFDTATMEFLPPLSIKSEEDDLPIRLASIVGVHEGFATLKYLKSNSYWYEATAELPEGYFE